MLCTVQVNSHENFNNVQMSRSLAADASVLPFGLNFELSTPACTYMYMKMVIDEMNEKWYSFM